MRGQYGLSGDAPRPTDDGTGEDAARLALEQQITGLELFVLDVLPKDAREGGMPRDSAGLTLRTAFQVALFVDLPRVCPLLSDLGGRGVDQSGLQADEIVWPGGGSSGRSSTSG